MDIIIREIEEKDYPALLSLLVNEIGSHLTDTKVIGSYFKKIRDDERYKTIVAICDNKVVGFASTVQFFTLGLDGNLLWLLQIAVKKEMQNKGIGTKILKNIEDYARENNCDSIILNSGVRRIDAHAFYKRNGYDTNSDSWCFLKKLRY